MKAEEFYKKQGGIELDKFDKKAAKFDYYYLIDFAEEYARIRVKSKLEEAAERAMIRIVILGNEDLSQVAPKSYDKEKGIEIKVFKQSITETPID